MNSHNKSHFFHSIPPDWRAALSDELSASYMMDLMQFVASERASSTPVYPPADRTFFALEKTPLEKVKVVIVGQDPYHGPGQAEGLSFSVPCGVKIPPSLRNIYKELHSDLGIPMSKSGSLAQWAEQGVLLLNATLTVREGKPKSHHGKGWEKFTDGVIRAVCKRNKPVVFLLWGRSAQEKCEHIFETIDGEESMILTAPHPSPLSAYSGFFGCRHFSETNRLLEEAGVKPINWG